MTTSINLKPILIGLLISGIVLVLFISGVLTKPMPTSSPVSTTKTSFVKMVYAGTPSTARYYDFALNGQIKPIGGPASIYDLYMGDQNSDYVMVYLDLMSAYNAATLNNTVAGILSVKPINTSGSQVVTSEHLKGGDVFNEKPLFLKGITSGWMSFKVKPLMSKDDIFKLIN